MIVDDGARPTERNSPYDSGILAVIAFHRTSMHKG